MHFLNMLVLIVLTTKMTKKPPLFIENQKKLQKRAGLWFLQHACTIVNHSPKDGSGWIPHSDQKQSPEPSLCISRQGSCSFSEHACTNCAHHKNDQKSSFFWLKIKRTSPPPPWSTHIPIYISLSPLSLSLSLSLSPLSPLWPHRTSWMNRYLFFGGSWWSWAQGILGALKGCHWCFFWCWPSWAQNALEQLKGCHWFLGVMLTTAGQHQTKNKLSGWGTPVLRMAWA